MAPPRRGWYGLVVQLRGVLLDAVVLLSGAAVLILELLGPLLLAPLYGRSHHVWAAIITVTLVGLAAGYAAGGALADRRPPLGALRAALLAAAAGALLVTLLRRPVLLGLVSLDPRAGALLASLLLFGLPMTALGAVAPLAARVRVTALDDVGRSVGRLYAVSTLGSVAGALVCTFVLLPALPLGTVALVVAGLLLAALAVTFTARPVPPAVAGAALLAAGALATGLAARPAEAREKDGVHVVRVVRSAYGEIRVVDDRRGRAAQRHLLVDGTTQTMIDAASGTSLSDYIQGLQLARAYRPQAREALVIGLGGGSLVKALARDGFAVTTVELDGALVDVARRDFGLPADLPVVVADGRRHVEDTDATFDLIFIDAFATYAIPEHLCSREAFATMRRRLRPGGVIAMNVTTLWSGPAARIWRSIRRTLAAELAHVEAFDLRQDRLQSPTNLLLFASDAPLAIDPGLDLSFQPERRSPDPEHRALRQTLRRRVLPYRVEVGPEDADALVLTDEHNPINAWQLDGFQLFREQILRHFPAEVLLPD